MPTFRRNSFYLALLICRLPVALLFAALLGELVALICNSDEPSAVVVMFSLALFSWWLIRIYQYHATTSKADFWTGDQAGNVAFSFSLGNIGGLYCILALAAMTAAKSGSGVALLPGIVWAAIFYRKGFDRLDDLRRAPPNNPPEADA